MTKLALCQRVEGVFILLLGLFILFTNAETIAKTTSCFEGEGDFSHLLNSSGFVASLSVIHSIAICLEIQKCKSFLYNRETKHTQILTSIESPSSPTAVNMGNWKYYVIKSEPRICDIGWEKFEESCYLFSLSSGSWQSGKSFCEGQGGYLVEITSLAEDTFVRDYVRTRGLTAIDKRDSWIGGTDVALENTFVWTGSGETFTYSNWGPNNPDNNNGNQHCTILYQPSDYKWHDTECTNTNSYICEK